MDVWADIVIPLVALAGGWLGSSWKYRHDRRDRLADLEQMSDELAEFRLRGAAEIEQDREHEDRDWIEKAAELCRSPDPKDRQHGRGFLVGLAAMGNKNPRVVELLDQVTQLELGQTVAEIREAKLTEDVPVEIIEEVVVSDGGSDAYEHVDGAGGAAGIGEDEAAEDRQEDQGDQDAGRRCPGQAGGGPAPRSRE